MTQQRLLVQKRGVKAILSQRLALPVTLVLIISLIAACGGGNDDTPPADEVGDAPPPGASALTCNEECRARGQCGESTDRGTVVLLNLEQPAVLATEHDLAIPAATAIEVREERAVTVQETATGVEFPATFYRVFVPDRSVEAWVAGWCVANP